MRKNTLVLSLIALLCLQTFAYPRIKHCEDARVTGIYTIVLDKWAVDAICDMDTDGGGWLVILNRRGGYEDFYKPWNTYKDEGIGSPETEYVLPLEFLHAYLSQDKFEFLQEMTEGAEHAWDRFSFLSIGSEEEKFQLKLGRRDSTSIVPPDDI